MQITCIASVLHYSSSIVSDIIDDINPNFLQVIRGYIISQTLNSLVAKGEAEWNDGVGTED